MSKWIGSWHASQTKFDTRFFDFTFSQISFENQTLRMIIHPHASGTMIRLKFSNRYGNKPVTIGKVVIAHYIREGETSNLLNCDLNFQGDSSITIPPGEERVSDPASFKVHAKTDLAVSIYLPFYTKTSTWHFTPAQSTYIAGGNQTEESDGFHFKTKIDSYYWLNGMDVMTEKKNSHVIVTLGDSITEGFTSTLNANNRWTDLLWDRIHQEYPNLNFSILNAGITGNLITIDGDDVDVSNAGEKTITRLQWDVLSQDGVTDVIFLQGINDILGNVCANKIIAGMIEVAKKVQHHHLRIHIGTITPFGNSVYFSKQREKARQDVNNWIRTKGKEVFDGVIDFNQALADPQTPNQILRAYDSGDHLHPNDKGFKALSAVVPISLVCRLN